MNEKSGKESDESRAKKEGGSGESEQGDGDGVTNEREAQVKMLLGALDSALCVQSIGRRSPRFQPHTPTSIKATGINRFIPRHDEVASKLGSDFWDFPRFAGESKFVEALSAVALLPAPGPDEADPLLLVLKQIAKVLFHQTLEHKDDCSPPTRKDAGACTLHDAFTKLQARYTMTQRDSVPHRVVPEILCTSACSSVAPQEHGRRQRRSAS